MRIFVTGATGYIGSALVRDLLDAGHTVLGLARSDASAEALAGTGAEVHRGALDDLDSLRRGAATADGVVHTAFRHEFDDYLAAAETDRRAVETFVAELAGSGRPLVVTSGTATLPHGRLGTEDDPADGSESGNPRAHAEELTVAAAARGVRSVVLRLPPSVHSAADRGGFVPTLIRVARERGVSAYVGAGANRWPAVHRADAVRLFRLAVEGAPAGSRLHAVDDEGVPFREIAEVIGAHLNLPVTSVDDAAGHFGWIGHFAAIDNPTSSALTRERLGWRPEGTGLIKDLAEGHYFEY